MAANHVQQQDPNLQNAALFGGDGRDGYSYNSVYAHSQPYPNNLLPEQQNPHLSNGTPSHSPYNPAPAYSPPAWQPSPTPTSISNPAQGHAYLTGTRGFYSAPNPNIPNAYLSGPTPQYNQPIDPSLARHGDNRPYGQSLGVLSPAPQSTATISPSALYQPAPVSRQPSSSTPVQAVPASRPVTQPLAPAAATPVVNAAPTQALKPPKGTQSGEFIIVSFEDMAKATQSVKFLNFANLGTIPIDLNISRINTPAYVPRKSQNELKILAATDPTLRSKINKRSKKHKLHIPKTARPASSAANKGSPVSLSSASDSSDSDSDTSYDSDASVPERSPLPTSRPPKAVEAVRYDTIKAVWSPRNRFPENEKVIQGLSSLWEVVRTIRERWVSDRDAVKEALKAKKDSELPLLRERVDKQLEMMETVLNASVEFGHPDVLSACGQSQPLMLALYSFLVEFVREGKYTATFVKAAFKFLSLCTNLNTTIAKNSGLDKLLARAVKRGNEEIKSLAIKINTNTAAMDKKEEAKAAKAKSDVKTDKTADSPKPTKQETKTKLEPTTVAGVKRARPAEGVTGQPAKRVAPGVPSPNAKDSAAAKLGLVKKAGNTTATATTATAIGTAKPKVVKPTTSFFSGLQSASKKPGTANATMAVKKAVGVPGDKKAPAPAAPMAATRPVFSFAETMANLSKEREQEPAKKVKEEETQAPETPEEKARRLRKEGRRHLRVQWKPDNVLVEVRTFKSDPSEMPRHVRDVRDGQDKEGLTLKQHMDMMDVDVDEDDDQPTEQSFFDFQEPKSIDFSVLPPESAQANYERYGGVLTPQSPEKEVQENHEANTLIAHYMVKSDIPPNPREPVDPYTGPQVETRNFGYPDEPWLNQRLQKFGAHAPVLPTNISALLQAFGAGTQPPPPVPQPAQATVPDLSALQGIVSQINAVAPQQQPPPSQQTFSWPQQPVSTGQDQPKSLDAILAELSGNSAPQPVSQPAAAPAPAPTPTPDVSNLIAQLMQSAQGGGANAAGTAYPAYGQPDSNYYNSSSTQFGTSNTNQLDQQTNAGAGGGERGGAAAAKRGKWQGNPGKKFLLQCRFYKEGKCKKGGDCTFRHD